jgi:peroxiredoxin
MEIVHMNSIVKRMTVCGLSLCLSGMVSSAFAQTGANPTPPPSREKPAGRERPARPDQPGRERPARPERPAALKVGDKAPEWTLTDSRGKTHKSADLAGKVVVLEWVNPGCPVCKGVHKDGRIGKMLSDVKSMKDVVFIGVNSTATTTADENNEALKGYGVDYPVLLDNDGKVGHAFGAKNTPHVFVIDGKGILRYAGAIDNNEKGDMTGDKYVNYAVNAVKQIQANETVSPDSTKPYGCTVKYGRPEPKDGGAPKPGREAPGRTKPEGH